MSDQDQQPPTSPNTPKAAPADGQEEQISQDLSVLDLRNVEFEFIDEEEVRPRTSSNF